MRNFKILIFVLSLFLIQWVSAQDGGFDKSFNGNSYHSLSIGKSFERTQHMTRQADGKIIVVGYLSVGQTRNAFVARYMSDGAEDLSFGDGGKVIFYNFPSTFYSVVVQKDGKLVISGVATQSNQNNFLVARLESNGNFDKSFAGKGYLTQPVGDLGAALAYKVVVGSDGKIVVGGYAWVNGQHYNFAMIRLKPDGTLDADFGTAGISLTDIGSGTADFANDIILLTNGGILMVGSTRQVTPSVLNYDFAMARFNSYGRLDNTFSSDGKVTTDFAGQDDAAYSVLVLSNGGIIVGGYATEAGISKFALAKYSNSGILDISFDKDGKVMTTVNGESSSPYDMNIQSDDKIVLAGNTLSGKFCTVRYSAYGVPDNSYGKAGINIQDLGGGIGGLRGIVILSDRKALVCGYSSLKQNTDGVIARLNTDGSPDISFGNKGLVYIAYNLTRTEATSLSIQMDGKILAGAIANDALFSRFALARFNEDGTLGDDFAEGGKFLNQTCPSCGDELTTDMTVQQDGKILLFGITYSAINERDNYQLIRLHPDGRIDSSFGKNGIVNTDFDSTFDRGISMAVQSDRKIICSGFVYNGQDWDFGLVRYLPDGSLDSGFGVGGKLITAIGRGNDVAYALAIQTDGKIVAGGLSVVDTPNIYHFAMVRYETDGSLDQSFNGSGKVIIDFGTDFKQGTVYTIRVQKDGKLLLSGEINNITTGGKYGGLVRLNADGSLDKNFGNSGMLIISVDSFFNNVNDMVVQEDGKIICGGRYGAGNSGSFLVRYNSDGSIDKNFAFMGILRIGLQGPSLVNALALQVDGKIVLAGNVYTANKTELYVMRLLNKLNVGVLSEGKLANNFLVYPNPVSDEVSVGYTLVNSGIVHLKILDLKGSVLQEIRATDAEETGDHTFKFKLHPSIQTGVYILQLHSGNEQASVQIFVNKT
ncbi:MAG: T9SS type A sorting domain-containing protein [Saprospiraceae bacterium]|nr:T9SS type A sorting domain-containing protein [Candidatus Vicinibacter affinis]